MSLRANLMVNTTKAVSTLVVLHTVSLKRLGSQKSDNCLQQQGVNALTSEIFFHL